MGCWREPGAEGFKVQFPVPFSFPAGDWGEGRAISKVGGKGQKGGRWGRGRRRLLGLHSAPFATSPLEFLGDGPLD